MHPYLLTPIRRIVRRIARRKIPQYFKDTPIIISTNKSDIIVSLTSFPARIHEVHLVIQCMLRQTVSPHKIILWLSRDQFEGIQLPDDLTSLQNEIFNIRFVDGDIRSHKKYFYVLSEFPENKILIVDDDLYYPTDMLEIMSNISNLMPDTIICRYGSIMQFKKGHILPYNDWWSEISDESDNPNFFFGSGGGILLTRKMLYNDALNINLAQKLTPLADDVWLNAMINLAKTPKYKVKFGIFMSIQEDVAYKLSDENVANNKNDIQIENLITYYKKKNLNPFIEKIN